MSTQRKISIISIAVILFGAISFGVATSSVEAQSMKRLAHTFAYVKNAGRLLKGYREESLENHIGWAMEQSDPAVVKEEIKGQLTALEKAFESRRKLSCKAFGNLKTARLMITKGITEVMSDHVKWCDGVDFDIAEAALMDEIKEIRKNLK